ncbi:UNKNOWN [Stylonychia lemnae]|uniref:Uncharacterized protein n=1 Tax=Stylonychia lemnae TaxID=5949 RepID=A0A078B8F2_STYLE|nr:UNKNOWN [Stylonychia lemnae]|eukprot:CDW90684.1 UNKNOWN [Stylonychia lemnae]
MSRANSVQNQSGKQRLILQQRLKHMNQPKEITMDLAIEGSRNGKHLNFDSGMSNLQGEYMDRANTSCGLKRSSNNLKRPVYGASIKVFHDQEDMKWTQSKLYKKFFNSNKHMNQTFEANLNYDDPTLDPSKQFSHDSMFKRRQLQSKIFRILKLILDQSQIFVDRYNNNYDQSNVMQIKRKIESMSVDNPFTYVEMQNKKLAGETISKNIKPYEIVIADQTNNFRPHPLMMKRGSVVIPSTKSIRNQTNFNTLTQKNLQTTTDQNIKVNTLVQNTENLNQDERRLRIREQILKVIQKSPQKAKDMYQYINNYTRTQQKSHLNSQLLNESQ